MSCLGRKRSAVQIRPTKLARDLDHALSFERPIERLLWNANGAMFRLLSKEVSRMKTKSALALLAASSLILLVPVSHAQSNRVGPAEIYPDDARTPGVTNPDVTQENIKDNICSKTWSTKLIRPPVTYTNTLKKHQIVEYGDTVHQPRASLVNSSTGKTDTTKCVDRSDNPACYEEDHLISLENGGNPKDPKNLWPEPYNTKGGGVIMGAHQKDIVEGLIHDEICFDTPNSKKNSHVPATTSISLQRGQEILAGDWYACYESIKKGEPCK